MKKARASTLTPKIPKETRISNRQQVEHANANESDRVENASVIDVLGKWAASSTVHGLSHAFDREQFNRPKRSVWSFLVLASFGIMIWQISVLIAEYTKYAVQTNSHIKYPTSIAFPYVINNGFTNTAAPLRFAYLISTCSDVTVCNSNILVTSNPP
jgi:hypothetical protein